MLLLALLGYCFDFCRPGRSKNIGVCVSAQRKPLLFQHLYLSYVLFHVLTLSPKDGRAAALYGKDPYGMSSESTALYIGITSLPEYFAEPCVMPLKTAGFCRRHKERAPSKFFTCWALLKLCRRLPSGRLFFFQETYLPSPNFIFNLSIFNQFAWLLFAKARNVHFQHIFTSSFLKTGSDSLSVTARLS